VAHQHKYAKASASISTSLDPGRIAEIVELAAKEAETLEVIVRLEESSPGRLVYSARNRLMGGHVEFMTFDVVLKESDGMRTVKTRILTYRQRRQWILFLPLPWQMIAWRTYRRFMYGLATRIKEADAVARTTVHELVGA